MIVDPAVDEHPECVNSPAVDLSTLIKKHSGLPSDLTETAMFTDVLHELTSGPLNNLPCALEQSVNTRKYLQNKLECLAIEHYPVFLAKADASENVIDSIDHIRTGNRALISRIPEFAQATNEFSPKANAFMNGIRLGAKALERHTQLLELLELPQLMETSIHNDHFEDAITILTYTRKLLRKHGSTVPIIKTINSQVNAVGLQLVQRLCNQLRSPLSLPACIKIVVFLRRTEVFTEQELRLKFLQTRSTCLDHVLATSIMDKSISSGTATAHLHLDTDGKPAVGELRTGTRAQYDAYWRATRRVEVTRVHLFDIITQYRTVFLEEDTIWTPSQSQRSDVCLHPYAVNPLRLWDDRQSAASNQTHNSPFQSPKTHLFSSWLLYRILLFLDAFKADLKQLLDQPAWDIQHIADRLFLPHKPPAGGSGGVTEADLDPEAIFTQLQSLYSQTMYFGRSFSRIGCDFRPHLVDLFNKGILEFVRIFLKNSINEFTVALGQLLWKTTAPQAESVNQDVDGQCLKSTLPLSSKLCTHPPLVFLYNRIMQLFNGLRICCPVNLKDALLHSLVIHLTSASQRVAEIYRILVDQHPINWRSDATTLADTFTNVLIPHLLTCFLTQLFHAPDHHPKAVDHTSPISSVFIHRLSRLICKPMETTWPRVPIQQQQAERVGNSSDEVETRVKSDDEGNDEEGEEDEEEEVDEENNSEADSS